MAGAANLIKSLPEWAADVTPNDSTDLDFSSIVYIGGDGNCKVTTVRGDTVTFNGLSQGDFIPVKVKRIWSTGTTTTNMIALR
jgi:hypothetical protein